MNQNTCQLLLNLNRQFYATVADDFDSTRLNVPMGMVRVLNYVRAVRQEKKTARQGDRETGRQGDKVTGNGSPLGEDRGDLEMPLTVLDAGCGNGRFCWALERLETPITYLGVDADEQLLAHAREHTKSLKHVRATFSEINLADLHAFPFTIPNTPFTIISSFAVLHHMPSYELRLQIVRWLASLLAANGVLLLSTWQFLNSPRLVAKQLDWSIVGVDPRETEVGDALLPWNQGTYAVRYAHQIDEDELRQLAADAGLMVKEIYYADGKEGNLNLYGVLCNAESISKGFLV